MIKYIVNRLKWFFAEEELIKLERLKLRINELEQWCGFEFPEVKASAKWLKDHDDYEGQFKGPKGDISDFREYMRVKFKTSETE